MTPNATPAATHALRALVAGAVLVGSSWLLTAPAHAGLGEPLDPDGTTTTEADESPAESSTTSTTEADEPATTVADGPTTTVATSGDADEPASTTEDDDGTSIAALGAVGVVAFILGLLVAAIPLGAALSRRKSAAARPGPPVGAPAPGPAPTPAPAAAAPASAGPAIGPAPSRDSDQLRQQRVVLVEALIALRDKLPSEALSGEAAQALAGVGITELRPEGVAFDPAQHRAVHQIATDDPARHNTVAGVERPGYRDGSGAIIRQPEVVVAVHGSPS